MYMRQLQNVIATVWLTSEVNSMCNDKHVTCDVLGDNSRCNHLVYEIIPHSNCWLPIHIRLGWQQHLAKHKFITFHFCQLKLHYITRESLNVR